MTVWRVLFACWITATTNTHSEYVILTAFPQQQWLNKRVSLLHYTCILPRAFDSYNKQLFDCRTLPGQRGTIGDIETELSFVRVKRSFKKEIKHYIKFVKLTLPGAQKKPAAEVIWTKKEGSGGMLEDAAKWGGGIF